jgi:hypothetical protein
MGRVDAFLALQACDALAAAAYARKAAFTEILDAQMRAEHEANGTVSTWRGLPGGSQVVGMSASQRIEVTDEEAFRGYVADEYPSEIGEPPPARVIFDEGTMGVLVRAVEESAACANAVEAAEYIRAALIRTEPRGQVRPAFAEYLLKSLKVEKPEDDGEPAAMDPETKMLVPGVTVKLGGAYKGIQVKPGKDAKERARETAARVLEPLLPSLPAAIESPKD